jgi:hypothetical protein
MKSEVIQFSTMWGRNCVDDVFTLRVSDASIQPSSTVKNLAVTLDQKQSFNKHISMVCKQCFAISELCAMFMIRCPTMSLGLSRAHRRSRLDYCNSLLVGTSKSNIAQLQCVQNMLARVVLRHDKHQHIKKICLSWASLAADKRTNHVQDCDFDIKDQNYWPSNLSQESTAGLRTHSGTEVFMVAATSSSHRQDCSCFSWF